MTVTNLSKSQGAKGAKKKTCILYRSSYRLTTKSDINALLSKILKLRSLEHLTHYVSQLFTRDHSLKKHKISSGELFDQLSEFFETYVDDTNNGMVIGDFNYHWNEPDDTSVNRMRLLLASHNFAQHVTEPTHTNGHTLDVVITPRESTLLHPVYTSSYISDHAAIHCDLNNKKTATYGRIATFRKLNKINNVLFTENLAACFLYTSSVLDGLFDQFTLSFTDIIYKHAPLTTRTIPTRQSFPWYSIDIKLANTGLTIHRDIFIYHRSEEGNS